MQEDDPGYAIKPNVLPSDECDALIRAIGGLTRSRAGARYLMRFTEIAGIAKDERLTFIAAGRLGGTAIPFRATLFDKSATANWPVPWRWTIVHGAICISSTRIHSTSATVFISRSLSRSRTSSS